MDTTEIDIQQKCREFVDREVYACTSHLISELVTNLKETSEWYDDLLDLCQGPPSFGEYTCPFCYETFEAEYEQEITCPECQDEFEHEEADNFDADDYQEIFEHWIVSRRLAEHLEDRGEVVNKDFMGLCIWARTTTGQAILFDGVIVDIVKELIP